MKHFLNLFFVILGVIFFVILLAVGFILITSGNNDGVVLDKHPLLSSNQEKVLETFGIDPADLPSEISPEQEKCFEEAIGEDRVAEIKAGDTPTFKEFFKSKSCI